MTCSGVGRLRAERVDRLPQGGRGNHERRPASRAAWSPRLARHPKPERVRIDPRLRLPRAVDQVADLPVLVPATKAARLLGVSRKKGLPSLVRSGFLPPLIKIGLPPGGRTFVSRESLVALLSRWEALRCV